MSLALSIVAAWIVLGLLTAWVFGGVAKAGDR